jgi:hypothetical protein
MAIIQAMVGTTISNGPPPPAVVWTPPSGFNGSLILNGVNSRLSIPGSADFAPGTGAFTIECIMRFSTGGGSFPRLFSIGTYPHASVACSLEGGGVSGTPTIYFWIGGTVAVSLATSTLTGMPSFLGNWHHLVLQRNASGVCSIHLDGNYLAYNPTPNTGNVNNNTDALDIGAEKNGPGSYANWLKASITNFRWTNAAVYPNSSFAVPTHELLPLTDTKYLLLCRPNDFFGDTSTSAHTTTGNGGITLNPLSVYLQTQSLANASPVGNATVNASNFVSGSTFNDAYINFHDDTALASQFSMQYIATDQNLDVTWNTGSTAIYGNVYVQFHGGNIWLAPDNATGSAAVAGTWNTPAYIRLKP